MLGMSRLSEVDALIEYMNGDLGEDYLPDVSSKVLKVNHDDCVGCGECMKACASGAVHYAENGLAEIDPDKCIDCGYCAYACPVRAIIRV
jgi:ferredoxin